MFLIPLFVLGALIYAEVSSAAGDAMPLLLFVPLCLFMLFLAGVAADV